MQTDSFAGMFDKNADQWARQSHDLSDFTADVVLHELAPVAGKHVLDLGCGEGYVARLVAQPALSRYSVSIFQRDGRACTTGWRERCTVPDEFRERECYEFSGLSAESNSTGRSPCLCSAIELR